MLHTQAAPAHLKRPSIRRRDDARDQRSQLQEPRQRRVPVVAQQRVYALSVAEVLHAAHVGALVPQGRSKSAGNGSAYDGLVEVGKRLRVQAHRRSMAPERRGQRAAARGWIAAYDSRRQWSHSCREVLTRRDLITTSDADRPQLDNSRSSQVNQCTAAVRYMLPPRRGDHRTLTFILNLHPRPRGSAQNYSAPRWCRDRRLDAPAVDAVHHEAADEGGGVGGAGHNADRDVTDARPDLGRRILARHVCRGSRSGSG